MKRVILSDDLRSVEKALRYPGLTKFMLLHETPQSDEIRRVLKDGGRRQELSKSFFSEKHLPDLRDEYIKFIGKLNMGNASLFWWAYFFTNKNPIASGLFYNISDILIFKHLLKEDFANLIVITNNSVFLEDALPRILPGEYAVYNLSSERMGLIKTMSRRIPFLSLIKFFRLLFFKILIRLSGVMRNIRIDPGVKYTLVRTIVTEGSFSGENVYRDTYFGGLVKFLTDKRDRVIVAATLSGNYANILRKIRRAQPGITIVPVDAYISVTDAVKALLISVTSFFETHILGTSAVFYDIDVSPAIRDAMREDIASTAFFSHIESYYAMKGLARRIDIKRLLYPMENRPWERMMIEAVRPVRADCNIAGYQHASIGPKHMNFFFIEGEVGITPFPDKIITTGEAIKDILVHKCGIPEDMIMAGCAIRQHMKSAPIKDRPGHMAKVLVVLASRMDEYLETIRFVKEAFYKTSDGSTGLSIRLRPHPTISIYPALKYLRDTGVEFEISKSNRLIDDLEWSDTVLYVSSTVSLEAMMMGIPVVYLDVDPLLSRDPLHGISILNWHASEPDEVAGILRMIAGIGEDEFRKRQLQAREYVEAYLRPVSDKRMEVFLQLS